MIINIIYPKLFIKDNFYNDDWIVCFSIKLLASVYERHNESSIVTISEKQLLKILAARWFYYRKVLLLRRHERSECHFCLCFCCWGFGARPEQGHRVGIYHGSEKIPFVYPCLKSFCFWFLLIFLRHLPKIAPDWA